MTACCDSSEKPASPGPQGAVKEMVGERKDAKY
jgi:hypothetical protein